MQTVSLFPASAPAPPGPGPVEPPRGAAFGKVLKDVTQENGVAEPVDPNAVEASAPESDDAEQAGCVNATTPRADASAPVPQTDQDGQTDPAEDADTTENTGAVDLAATVAAALVWPSPFTIALAVQTTAQIAAPLPEPLAAVAPSTSDASLPPKGMPAEPVRGPLKTPQPLPSGAEETTAAPAPAPLPQLMSPIPAPVPADATQLRTQPAAPSQAADPGDASGNAAIQVPDPIHPILVTASPALPTHPPPPANGSPTSAREGVAPPYWALHTAASPTGPDAPNPAPIHAQSAAADLSVAESTSPAHLLPVAADPGPDLPDTASIPAPLPPSPQATAATPTTLHRVAPGLPANLCADIAAVVEKRPDGPVDISLAPAELGRLRISLIPDGDGLRIAVHAERSDTLDLLRRNSDVLMQEIRAAGFIGGTLSFSGGGGAAQGGPSSQNPPSAPLPPEPPQPAHHAATMAIPPPQTGLDLRL